MAKKAIPTIRPELIGATITTKKHPSPIKVSDTQPCIELCQKLGLDVFTKEVTPETK